MRRQQENLSPLKEEKTAGCQHSALLPQLLPVFEVLASPFSLSPIPNVVSIFPSSSQLSISYFYLIYS